MIKIYNYSNLISRKEKIKAKNKVDSLIKNGNYCKNVPSYQTWETLYEYEEFKIFLNTFIHSCFSYLGEEKSIKRLKMWCFVDCLRNNITKDQEKQWHSHDDGQNKLSGIFYLRNLRKEMTEFKDIDVNNLKYHPFSWYIYPSFLIHRPPKIKSIRNRYTIAADLSF